MFGRKELLTTVTAILYAKSDSHGGDLTDFIEEASTIIKAVAKYKKPRLTGAQKEEAKLGEEFFKQGRPKPGSRS